MTKKQQPPRSNSGLLVIALVVFVISVWMVRHKTIGPTEQHLFFTIYDLPHWLRPAMLLITQAGSTWMVAIVTVTALALKKVVLALQVLSVGLSSFLLVELVKLLVARPRPFELISTVVARERFVTGFGFPSGHTAVATAVAIILFRYVPKRWQSILPIWVGLVAFSRIYLGVHAPIDILGGLALGTFVAEGFWMLWPSLSSYLKKPIKT